MKKYIVEFIGTFFLVFTICGAVQSGGGPAVIAIGLVLAAMIFMGGPISGAHYNPAVTLAILIRQKISASEAGAYWVSQIVGGIAAAFAGAYAFGKATPIVPGPDVEIGRALLVEVLFTFALALTVLNVAVSKRAGNPCAALAIGLVIVAGAYAGGWISGGAYNPAVGIGLSVGASQFQHVWLYLVGPFVGAILASLVFGVLEQDEPAA